MENSRTCDIYNTDVLGASMQKHLKSQKNLESGKQNEMIIR